MLKMVRGIFFLFVQSLTAIAGPTNVILCMADDLGWGDVGYNGHPHIRTPNLDELAARGIRFDRFYSQSPVCSPTRGSCLTGRHPYRYGVFGANKGHLPKEEVTLAETLKNGGYVTGHFGKWHLGTLTKTVEESNRGGPRGVEHYSPPWEHGFDVCFSTEAKVPTWDPMVDPDSGEHYGTYYWNEDGERVAENLEGDDSRVIMDRVIPFIREAVEKEAPFFAVIWFHTPHHPVVAGPAYRGFYADLPPEKQHYYGCVTAMDEQIGRLMEALAELDQEKETMFWFCSDNGPSKVFSGSAGPYRDGKGTLFEGGIRVPALLYWPEGFPDPKIVSVMCCTTDYFPTVVHALDIESPDSPTPRDGVSLLPMIKGEVKERGRPIAFEHWIRSALVTDRYKILSEDEGAAFALYDLSQDPAEATDLSSKLPAKVRELREMLESTQESWKKSREGEDY